MIKKFAVLVTIGIIIFGASYAGSTFAVKASCDSYLAMTIGGKQNEDLEIVIPETDGYLLAGKTASNTIGDCDIALIRTDLNGNIVSQKLLGGTKFDSLVYIEKTQDNGYILLGTTKSYGTGTGDSLIIKLDSSLNIEWARTFGTNKIASLHQTNDKGYILCGSTIAFGTGDTDAIIIKLEEKGFISWSKTYAGSRNDEFVSINQTVDGGYVLSGNTSSFDAQGTDVFAMKTDNTGNAEWSKIFTADGSESTLNAVKLNDGGYFVVANTNSFGNRSGDIVIVKTDSNGNTSWNKVIGGDGFEEGNSITQTSDGGILIAGGTKSFSNDLNGFISKINANGGIDWTTLFTGKNDDEYSYAIGNGVEFDAVGWSNSFGSRDIDMLFTKGSVPFSSCGCGNFFSSAQFKTDSVIFASRNISFKISDATEKIISLAQNVQSQAAVLTTKKICPITHLIKVSANGGGVIEPSGSNEVIDGESLEVEVTANNGYKINRVLVDGKEIQAISENYMKYRLDNVTSDHEISAEFVQLPIVPSLITITLQIGNSSITINGQTQPIDAQNSKPIIKNGRTLVPIRAVIEALGGSIIWNASEQKVSITLKDKIIELWIGKNTAKANGVNVLIDSTNSKVVPEIINGRTMIPLRFVTENLGCTVVWEQATQKITITYQP